MAAWLIRRREGVVTLTYCTAGKPPQDCGQTDAANQTGLEAFVADEMVPFDTCQVPSGATFFRQSVPAFGARA